MFKKLKKKKNVPGNRVHQLYHVKYELYFIIWKRIHLHKKPPICNMH